MANNVTVKDAAGANQVMKTTDNTGVHTAHHNVDSSALPTGASTLVEQQTQSTHLGQIELAVEVLSAAIVFEDTPVLTGGGGFNVLAVLRTTPAALASAADWANLMVDGSQRLYVRESCQTATRTQVADSATDVLVLASNVARVGATIWNDSSATLFLGLGTVAVTATNYTARIVTGAYYEVPKGFTGEIRGIWATDPGDGAARVTELT